FMLVRESAPSSTTSTLSADRHSSSCIDITPTRDGHSNRCETNGTKAEPPLVTAAIQRYHMHDASQHRVALSRQMVTLPFVIRISSNCHSSNLESTTEAT